MQVSGEKIAYFAERLASGNRVRYCALVFAALIVPMFWVKGLSGVFDMLVLALLSGFMLRNIDPLFARALKGTGSSPAAVVPFILPLAMMSLLGAIFDGLIVIRVVLGGEFPWQLGVLVLSVIARVVVVLVTVPLVRMMFDANYAPADLQARTDSGQLLQRRPEVPMRDEVTTTNNNQFRPFSGTGQTLTSSATVV